MTDSSDDETGVREHFIGVVMAGEVATAAVRDDDQRQLVAEQWTILHPRQGENVETNLSRRFGAGIPDRAVNRRTVGVGGNIDRSQAGGLRQRRREAEADGGKESRNVVGSVHRLLLPVAQ